MAEQRFRVWFGDTAADEDQLRRIEEIEVTQEMDAFWEARLRMVLCLDANGAWLHWPGETSEPFSRVRVELDIGNGRFAPLIDGPLTSIDAALDSQPGRSTATLVVRDDSAFLNRDEETEPPFEHRSASDIAQELFGRFTQLADTRIDSTEATPETTTRRGTVLQFLRELATANDRHAYVLPGDTRGASIGCFLADPTDAADLPPLVMIGNGRNLANASVTQDPEGGERTIAQVLRVDDQGVTHFETSAADLGLMRGLPALPADLTPRRMLPPAEATGEDPTAAVTSHARRSGYVFHLVSQVIPGCYGAVLSPYRKVRLDAGATPYSGDYLLTKVVHRITPSLYTQEIEAKADSLSEVSGAAVAESLGGGLQLSVSASVGIF
ncbi:MULTISPECIES: hypothetical protein [unclassified Pseudomonas]|uniref:hypothetical protein n=1 Tax=unclassified Pseudomonas TaxID=196821 RepID=UPI00129E8F8F|nr:MULTISPECIES: hypothetical protein [unclassified Pseudomonas]MDH4652626.1 hypothetical protein [Pseudomonas sp. BN606]MRK20500.1 hypothetical protein [Pseudomonas sp. JG-B]